MVRLRSLEADIKWRVVIEEMVTVMEEEVDSVVKVMDPVTGGFVTSRKIPSECQKLIEAKSETEKVPEKSLGAI